MAFYRSVFGWDTSVMGDTPELRYTTLGADADALAGIMDLTSDLHEGAPGSWWIYFAVEDTDAAVARVVELGGTVVRAPEDTPYGRLAQVADPTGAGFRLMGQV